MARESLFNILQNHFNFEELDVLDLFSGTGIMACEFLSRGCRHVATVELQRDHVKFIYQLKTQLSLDHLQVLNADAYRYLKKTRQTFDIIFADPPYNQEGIAQLPEIIFERKLLNKNGWFILEHSKKYEFQSHPNFLESRKYGAVHFSMFGVVADG